MVVLLSNEVERKQETKQGDFSILWDTELMGNADKHVQIDNTDIPCAERDS